MAKREPTTSTYNEASWATCAFASYTPGDKQPYKFKVSTQDDRRRYCYGIAAAGPLPTVAMAIHVLQAAAGFGHLTEKDREMLAMLAVSEPSSFWAAQPDAAGPSINVAAG